MKEIVLTLLCPPRNFKSIKAINNSEKKLFHGGLHRADFEGKFQDNKWFPRNRNLVQMLFRHIETCFRGRNHLGSLLNYKHTICIVLQRKME